MRTKKRWAVVAVLLLVCVALAIFLVCSQRAHSPVKRVQYLDLYDAARAGDLESVKLLLESEPDQINSPSTWATNLWHKVKVSDSDWTVDNSEEEMGLILPRLGLEPKGGGTVLEYAALGGHKEVVEYLLDKGAKVNQSDGNGGTALAWAAAYGRKDVVAFLLAKGADINAADAVGDTALHCAARAGQAEVVELLLSKGAEVTSFNEARQMPISLAAEAGEMQAAEVLVAHGSPIDDTFGGGHKPPLYWAAQAGKTAMIKFLLDHKANAKWTDPDGLTAMHLAALSGNTEVVRTLIAAGVDVDGVGLVSWYAVRARLTPLMYAVYKGPKEMVELLIEKGANVNFVRPDGGDDESTPLGLACSRGRLEIVEFLLSAGANVHYAGKNGKGRTALHEILLSKAPTEAKKRIVELLVGKGIDINAVDKDSFGTALHLAVDAADVEMTKLLLGLGAGVDVKDHEGRTPLNDFFHYGRDEKGAVETLNLLLAAGADVNTRDNEGRTPLHGATDCMPKSGMQVLLDHGADINAHDAVGSTPLHVAAGSNNGWACTFLLSKGARLDAKDNEGHMPLDVAVAQAAAQGWTASEKAIRAWMSKDLKQFR